jgi:hypothetical protein
VTQTMTRKEAARALYDVVALAFPEWAIDHVDERGDSIRWLLPDGRKVWASLEEVRGKPWRANFHCHEWPHSRLLPDKWFRPKDYGHHREPTPQAGLSIDRPASQVRKDLGKRLLEPYKALWDEMCRRRDEWDRDANDRDAVIAALWTRMGVGDQWPPTHDHNGDELDARQKAERRYNTSHPTPRGVPWLWELHVGDGVQMKVTLTRDQAVRVVGFIRGLHEVQDAEAGPAD